MKNLITNIKETLIEIKHMAIYQLVVDIYKFPKHLCSGLLMALT